MSDLTDYNMQVFNFVFCRTVLEMDSPGIFFFPSCPIMHMAYSDRWVMIRCPSSQIAIPSTKGAVRPLSWAQWAFSPSVAYVTTISVLLSGRE